MMKRLTLPKFFPLANYVSHQLESSVSDQAKRDW